MNSPAVQNTLSWQGIILLASVSFGVVAILYAALYWDSNKQLDMLSGKPDQNRVDLFAEQIHGVKFDSDGKLTETLRAQRLDHYPERNESVLAEPIVDTQGKDSKTWKITAATGTLLGDDEIQLQNNVVIVDNTKTFRFESERLNYSSDKQLATTDDAVKLQHLTDVTTAVGMRANLNTNRVEFLRQVDSRYAQPK